MRKLPYAFHYVFTVAAVLLAFFIGDHRSNEICDVQGTVLEQQRGSLTRGVENAAVFAKTSKSPDVRAHFTARVPALKKALRALPAKPSCG